MSLFDKDILDGVKNRIKAPGLFRKEKKPLFAIQTMMVGGRRCGKTSVLSVMQYCFEKVCGNYRLQLIQDDENTRSVLTKKYTLMQDYFTNPEFAEGNFIPDDLPNHDLTKYSLNLEVSAKNNDRLQLDFLDYPGGWLIPTTPEYKSHMPMLEQFMLDSSVLIIAIDTPHMMEEDGDYNEARNLCNSITSTLVKNLMSDEDRKKQKRLILFVPLKCERYLHDGRMYEVNSKVKDVYGGLINFFRIFPDQFEVAITPIFTMGNADFNDFARDEKNHVIVRSSDRLPDKPLYHLTGQKFHQPEFCEQPLLYLLAFMMVLAEQYKNDVALRWLTDMWREFIGHLTGQDYNDMKLSIIKRMKKDGNGYEILQDPLHLD